MTIKVNKQRSGSVFRGYFDNDDEVQSPDVFRKKSNLNKRDHFPVVYQGLAKVNATLFPVRSFIKPLFMIF